MKKYLIGITGGIGSGKSIIASILQILGYKVYDCDSAAKILMDNNPNIKTAISTQINHLVVTDNGDINRQLLADIVFNNKELLNTLNKIVHGAVLSDLLEWKEKEQQNILFVETAILYTSGINHIVDEVWEISAPENIRINRVVTRNNTTPDKVKSRITSQQTLDYQKHSNTHIITNDNTSLVLPQVLYLLNNLK